METERSIQNIQLDYSQLLALVRKAFPECQKLDDWKILSGGALNTTYKIQIEKDAIVLRLYARDRLHCKTEKEIHRLIDKRYAFTGGRGSPGECGMVKACEASGRKATDADNPFMGLAKQGNAASDHPPSPKRPPTPRERVRRKFLLLILVWKRKLLNYNIGFDHQEDCEFGPQILELFVIQKALV